MRTVCGLDVHKDTVYLCILSETGKIFKNVYGVLTYQLRQMRRDMRLHGVTEATMESTATYWIPVWRVLELCKGVTDPEELIRKVHGRIVNKHGRETILASLTGVGSQAEKDTMRQLREEIGLAEKNKQYCLGKYPASSPVKESNP